MHHALTLELAREHTQRRMREASSLRAAAPRSSARNPLTGGLHRRRRIGRLLGATAGPARFVFDASND